MIAVVILAPQNNGKTTTINYFDHLHDPFRPLKKHCKIGNRWLRLFQDCHFLSTHFYFVPASPTETGKPLSDRLGGYRPNLILVAEQLNSNESQNTIAFLKKESYKVHEIIIDNNSEKKHWRRWNNNNFKTLMEKRARDIGDIYREYIRSSIN